MVTQGSLWTGECAGAASPRAGLGITLFLGKAFASPCSISVHSPTSRFVVYKLPAHSGPVDGAQSGLQYKYLDEGSGGWRDGARSIDSLEGAVGRSLLPLYRNTSQVKGSRCRQNPGRDSRKGRPGGKTSHPPVHSPQLAYLLYNDQPPADYRTESSSSRGHTKGESS